MKRILTGLALLAAVFGSAQAITTDSVILTIQPVFSLSVNISSDTHTFGSDIVLGTSKTLCVGNIINDGNITTIWQKASVGASGGAGLSWSLITSGYPNLNEFRLLAVTSGVPPTFISLEEDSLIAGDYNSTSLLNVNKDGSNAFSDLVEDSKIGAIAPYHAAGETRKLWVSIMMPRSLTDSTAQTITLSVRAAVR